jgi:predicted flap endonuclease-1-like 5' DNA nuclease
MTGPRTGNAGRPGDLPSIGGPARDALALEGVTRLDQLPAWTEKELLALHGVGPKAVRILREALAERGLAFRS